MADYQFGVDVGDPVSKLRVAMGAMDGKGLINVIHPGLMFEYYVCYL
jgi:hypothetical protein